MTIFSVLPEATRDAVAVVLGDRIKSISIEFGEVTVLVAAENYYDCALELSNAPGCRFEQLIDLCGVDFSEYPEGTPDGLQFCVVVHLLSVSLNQRLRLKVFAPDDLTPTLASVMDIWTAANWFEREAFDLFGIVFDGHTDLRRILTDYGFIGHPLRKDFPRMGHVEMRFDAELGRVIYQPVTIEERETTPRIIRESNYGGLQ
jgi:NADH-quinone oxidoreductase subunit C